MHHIQSAAIAVLMILGLALGAAAQSAIPDFRYLAAPDTDFYGSDLDPMFDTDLDACIRACTANAACAGFTYNARAQACFPKAAMAGRTDYQGALSAAKIPVDPAIAQAGEDRAAALGFLGRVDLDGAREQARLIGLLHATGEIGEIGAEVAHGDGAALWARYARALLAVDADNYELRDTLRIHATHAAINAYLRGDDPDIRASALLHLSRALERAGRGRDMITALRLADTAPPRADIAAALDDALGKYGFRVTDSTVDSDAAAPRICAEFSEPLATAGAGLEHFVRLPAPGLAAEADGRQLCIDGVEHGARYTITIRAGLPAQSGETLAKDVELTHYVRDRAPSVRFSGRAYVLPKTPDAALPVDTVNLSKLDLRLRRISDRNLLRTFQDDFFGRTQPRWRDDRFATDIAEEVWTGTAEIATQLNRDMTARLPLAKALAGRPAGIYALTARAPGRDDVADATQWFVLSDLGLGAISGADGLHVTVRGLGDAAPRAGIAVSLVSQSNAVLADAVTDADGHALFGPGLTRGTGGAAPALVLARDSDDDLGFLSLTDPSFDLSDRGVAGRAAPGPVDVFLTTDRGAYRAGETVHATVLARDAGARAIEGLPLLAVLRRPDGVEHRRAMSAAGVAGGHAFALPVGLGAPRGAWRLEIRTDPDAPALATRSFLVEDFMPERIDFEQSLPDAPLSAGGAATLSIQARYLFGAPGSDLGVEGKVILRAAKDVAGWPGYRFGRHDDAPAPAVAYFSGLRTDARGDAAVDLNLPTPDAGGAPLEATVITRLTDGSGRPTERSLTAPVRPTGPVIGIKPLFDDSVPEGAEAAFDIIALSKDLTPTPMHVKWALNRIETRYQWYQLGGDWNWEPTTRRIRIATGEGDPGAAPLAVSHPVKWGRYELRVEGDAASASVEFHAGWRASGEPGATPDRLEMSLDKPLYRAGDTARLTIAPRAAGTALVSVMSDRLIARHAVEVPAGQSVIPLNVTDDWGVGAYVVATVIRPMDVAAGRNPARALGLAHAAVDPGDKALIVAIHAPDVAEPRRIQPVRMTVTGAKAGEQVWLTLAAVDEGILNLTGFEAPDPAGHYFGQRRLGVDLRDVYGRLIDGLNGAMGLVRSGGDTDAGLRRQSPPPTQDLMARFSGVVEVGANGEVTVPVALPAFNGSVRLMAVAWSASGVGQASRDMAVRDPVVVTAALPRFLAPGDRSRIRLEVVHAGGPAGEMRLALIPKGAGIAIDFPPATFTLAPGGKAVFDAPVRANGVGDPGFDVVLTAPDGRALVQTLTLPVRANDPVVARTRRLTLGAGSGLRLNDDVFAGLKPGTGEALLSAGPMARLDAAGLLARLDRYPYGCTEQITSKAMPLLYLASVAEAAGMGAARDLRARVDHAIARILTRQAPSGAFGLWRANAGDVWLSAYAADFLSRARAEGHEVPDLAFRQAMDNLRNQINYAADFDEGGEALAYALMVLAREGAASMGDLRYYADVKGDAFSSPLGAAQLGAALASYGDQPRADAMFRRAEAMLSARPSDEARVWRDDFGTDLRDAAGVLTLASEAGSAAVDAPALAARIAAAAGPRSTQEASWTLLAAHALLDGADPSGLRIDGVPAPGPIIRATAGQDRLITAAGSGAVDITLTTMGVPDIPPPAGGLGYTIARARYTMDGAPMDAPLRVGDRFITVLTVTPHERAGARLMIDDPLPAGIEIDNPNLLRSGDVSALGWLDLSEAEHAEFRADRFLAAVDLAWSARTVTLAYVARAVSPGDFHSPAASVEDMYRPAYRARTASGRVTVAP